MSTGYGKIPCPFCEKGCADVRSGDDTGICCDNSACRFGGDSYKTLEGDDRELVERLFWEIPEDPRHPDAEK